MVDSTKPNSGLWRAGGDRHVSISDLLRAFSRTDPAPNRAWPINTTILLKLMSMDRPPKFSEEHWAVILQLAVGQSDPSIQSQSHIEPHSRERSSSHRYRDIDI